MRPRIVCLVTPGHVASNPRLVKEANALHLAGFQVRVVAGDYMAEMRPLDATVLKTVGWRCSQVRIRSTLRHVVNTALHRGARRGVTRIRTLTLATWANSSMSHALGTAASSEPADLYVGHNLPALPAVAVAARRWGTRFGFDAEDDHIGELDPVATKRTDLVARRLIERSLIPRCAHLTAASPGIAR
jgi:hypothetical protein